VQGLCIGGVGIGEDTQLGYVVFIRKESGAKRTTCNEEDCLGSFSWRTIELFKFQR